MKRACNLSLLFGILLGITACNDAEPPSPEHYRTLEGPILVKDLPRMGGDYPEVLMQGLSKQLIDEVNCIQPGVLQRFEIREEAGYIWTTRTIHYYLRPEAVAAAQAVAADQNDWISITSGYRDVGMQYYDWNWGQKLGFLAAVPGSSRHQAGQAIDVQYHDYWREHLLAGGWTWPYGTDDRPHFEWRENNTPDLMVESVRAFQRLWNRNNPSDTIGEDGAWGPATEARMEQTQAEGFEFGGCDLDLDGYADTIIGGDDCADDDPNVHPGAQEICGDNIDNDCVGGDAVCGGEDTTPDATEDATVADTSTEDTATSQDTTTAQDTATTTPDTTTAQDPATPSDATNPADAAVDAGFSAVQEKGAGPGAETATACGCRVRRASDSRSSAWWLGFGLVAFFGWRRRRG